MNQWHVLVCKYIYQRDVEMQKEFYPLSKLNANQNFIALFLPTVTSFRYQESDTNQNPYNARNETYANEILTTTSMTLQEFSKWNFTPNLQILKEWS